MPGLQNQSQAHENQPRSSTSKETSSLENQPLTTRQSGATSSPQSLPISNRSTTLITFEILKPLPKTNFTKPKKGGRKKQKTAILTVTPEQLLVKKKKFKRKKSQ